MAVAVDIENLGTANNDSGAGDSISITTGAAVPAGGFIVVGVGWFASSSVPTVSGGGLIWTTDKEDAVGSIGVLIASAQAPAGLAGGTTITAAVAAWGAVAIIMGGSSFTGVKTSNPVDGTPDGPNSVGTAVWTSGSYAISAGSVLYTNCYNPNNITNTPTAPSLEAWEVDNGGGPYAAVAEYRIEGSAGSYVNAGTWAGGGTNKNISVAYLAEASVADTGLAWIRA